MNTPSSLLASGSRRRTHHRLLSAWSAPSTRRGVRVGFCKPIGQYSQRRRRRSARPISSGPPTDSAAAGIDPVRRRCIISASEVDHLMERVVGQFHESTDGADVVVVEGPLPHEWPTCRPHQPPDSPQPQCPCHSGRRSSARSAPEDFERAVELAARDFGGLTAEDSSGASSTNPQSSRDKPDSSMAIRRPVTRLREITSDGEAAGRDGPVDRRMPAFPSGLFELLGAIPNPALASAP